MLKLTQLSKYYRSEQTVTQALRRVSIIFEMGEFVVITGESGSGKSTLLNVLSGLDTYEEGELEINGEETSYYSKEDWENYRSQYIGFIFQNYNIIDSYTVYQNVVAALTIQGYPKIDRKQRAMELIERVGLEKQAHQKSSTLSGGQKQRVSIARALAKDAPLIVADEPTGNLDKETGENIIKLLKEISQDKLVIMVTHDYEAVKQYATRRVRLFDGEIVEDVKTQKTTPKEIKGVTQHEGMKLSEKILMAFRNLWAMPKRLFLTLMIGLFIVFVFSLAYGSYVQASNVITPDYHPYFANNALSRVIVLKRDQTHFTSSEITDLENIANVRTLITFDPVLELSINTDDFYAMTRILPSTALNVTDLEQGRLPINANEIIAPDIDEFSLNQEIDFTISQSFYYFREPNTTVTEYETKLTVVGLYKVSQSNAFSFTFYLHESLIEKPYLQFVTVNHKTELKVLTDSFTVDYDSESYKILIDNTLSNDEITINSGYFNRLKNAQHFNNPGLTLEALASKPFTLSIDHLYIETPPTYDVTVTGIKTISTTDPILYMNETTFNQIFALESKQLALIVEDGYDANRVISLVDQNIYHTIYPADYSYGTFDFGVIGRIMSFVGIIFMLSVMYFLTYLSLRNIMRARKKDYVIYRSIGATQNDLNHVTIFELLIIFILAVTIVYALLYVNATFYTILPNYLRYYTFGNYVFAVILLLSLALLLGIRFNKRIFKDSVITALRVE